MGEERDDDERTIPAAALDAEGKVLAPGGIPLSALIDPEELQRFSRSIADLTQMECAVLLYNPDEVVPVVPDGEVQVMRSPLCATISRVVGEKGRRCLLDVHAAAHSAMAQEACVAADCIAGKGTLYACPVTLVYRGRGYPKAGIVAAAQDTHNFHFADRLSALAGKTLPEMEEILCETDKRALNAGQLRRIRSIVGGQARSFSQQISDRYAELVSLATVLSQRERLRRAYRELDGEFRIVGEIQRRLVPQTTPRIEGYELAVHYAPARRAGGDYYDFFPQGDGRWGFLIADVSGHGPPAAVVMAVLRTILHTSHDEDMEPEKTLAYANARIADSVMDDQFVTAFLATLRAKEGKLVYSAAGHNPPLLFDSSRAEVRPLSIDPALPLGVGEERDFPRGETKLAVGDMLILYTDGITDVRGAAGELFGEERLREVCARHARSGAQALRDAIIESVKSHGEGQPTHDDQTLVILQRKGA